MIRFELMSCVLGLLAVMPSCVVEDDGPADVDEQEQTATSAAPLPGSCVDRCGEMSTDQCSCDERCSEDGDCCSDYQAECVGGEDAVTGGSDASGGSVTGDPDPEGTTTGGSDPDTDTDDDASPECTLNVVLMGYWPPTNEMLRQWSTDEDKNLGAWEGEDWRGHGYDVYSYFPEFPPDGVPFNDPFGSEGWVGSADSDLQVDYQDTSQDFWRIVDETEPTIIITTSRGGSIGWEVEAIEGGHGNWWNTTPWDWSSDGHGSEQRPRRNSIEPRSWDAISTWRVDDTLPTKLPVDDIVAATDALGLVSVEVDETGTSGNYLSGFLGLHGLAYAEWTPNVLAAGHIHVGASVSNEDATALMEATLDAVLEAHPAATAVCP